MQKIDIGIVGIDSDDIDSDDIDVSEEFVWIILLFINILAKVDTTRVSSINKCSKTAIYTHYAQYNNF